MWIRSEKRLGDRNDRYFPIYPVVADNENTSYKSTYILRQ